MLPNLDPTDFWETGFEEDHPAGGLYPSIPLLSLHTTPVTLDNEWGELLLFLPTLLGTGLLYRQFRDVAWFLPLITKDGFADDEAFAWLLNEVRTGNLTGFWEVPPLDELPSPLSEPALVYLCRPTVVKLALVDELESKPTAKLTDAALQDLDEAMARSLRR